MKDKTTTASEQNIITPEEYQKKREESRRDLGQVFAGIMVIMLFPACGLVISLINIVPGYSGNGPAVTVSVISGVLMLLLIIVGMMILIQELKNLRNLKKQYMAGLSGAELQKEKRKIIRHRAVAGAAVACCVALSLGGVFLAIAYVHSTYDSAETLIMQGMYKDAYSKLEKIENKNYKDTTSLMRLCEAYNEYNKDNAERAYYILKNTEFSYQNDEQEKAIAEFRELLKNEHDAYEEKLEEERNKPKPLLPYPHVGLSESSIHFTMLGRATEVRERSIYDSDYWDLKAREYVWKVDGVTVFKATVRYRTYPRDGSVREVSDLRDAINFQGNNTNKNKSPSSKGPSVDGFSDPEDFYDEYWDDFFDYEDAEDYYYENRGK